MQKLCLQPPAFLCSGQQRKVLDKRGVLPHPGIGQCLCAFFPPPYMKHIQMPCPAAKQWRNRGGSVVAQASGDLVRGGGDKKPTGAGNGVYALMLINAVLFLCDKVLHLPMMQSLYLYHAHPHWWQWVTHTFIHANWGHISNNMFFLLTFGRLVEDTEGSFGVVFTYLACGIGAAFASYLLSPLNTVSVGASGAIFGLFVVSVLTRLQLNLRSLLESVVLGQFVMTQVLSELKSQMGGGLTIAGGLQVSHLAHLGGALAGVLLVLLLQRLPGGDEE